MNRGAKEFIQGGEMGKEGMGKGEGEGEIRDKCTKRFEASKKNENGAWSGLRREMEGVINRKCFWRPFP